VLIGRSMDVFRVVAVREDRTIVVEAMWSKDNLKRGSPWLRMRSSPPRATCAGAAAGSRRTTAPRSPARSGSTGTTTASPGSTRAPASPATRESRSPARSCSSPSPTPTPRPCGCSATTSTGTRS